MKSCKKPLTACLLLWTFFRTAEGEAVKLSGDVPQVYVKRGMETVLPCPVEVKVRNYAVSWSRHPERGERSDLNVPDHTNRLRWANDRASLMISKAAVDDAGQYYCRVTVPQKDTVIEGAIKLMVQAAPSTPHFLLQVPTNPNTGEWSLLCVTKGFYPADIKLSWTQESAGTPDVSTAARCLLRSDSEQDGKSQIQVESTKGKEPGSNNTTAHQHRCHIGRDSQSQEMHLISQVPLPPRKTIHADITLTCTIDEHPALDSPLSASFTWEAIPNKVIGCLNILKVGVISGLSIVFITTACRPWCKKRAK